MKPTRLLLALATLALTLLFAPTTIASGSSTPGLTNTKKLIKAVDVKACTVSIEFQSTKTTRVYKIDEWTTIRVNDNNRAKIADIKVGMLVGDCSERTPGILDTISVGGTATAPAAAAPKK